MESSGSRKNNKAIHMGKKKIIEAICKTIDTGNLFDLCPHLPFVFWQLYWQYWDSYNQMANKHFIRNLLLETLWGGCCE